MERREDDITLMGGRVCSVDIFGFPSISLEFLCFPLRFTVVSFNFNWFFFPLIFSGLPSISFDLYFISIDSIVFILISFGRFLLCYPGAVGKEGEVDESYLIIGKQSSSDKDRYKTYEILK